MEPCDNRATDEARFLAGRRNTIRLQLFGGQMSTLRFEENGNTGFITLTDPSDNKIGSAFNKEFREALHEVAVSDVRALVIRFPIPNGSGTQAWHSIPRVLS